MKFFLFAIIFTMLVFGGLFYWDTAKPKFFQKAPESSITPAEESVLDKVDYTANFSVVTDGITRDFSKSKYHNQSSDVYIESSDPTLIHVKKAGSTWGDFFNSLPMEVTTTCLITGDGEKFCDLTDGNLEFYLNGATEPNLLNIIIQPKDVAKIEFVSN